MLLSSTDDPLKQLIDKYDEDAKTGQKVHTDISAKQIFIGYSMIQRKNRKKQR